MICCWSHRKKKKKREEIPLFFKKILNKKLIMPTTPGTKKNKQQSSLSFSARHYSHKPGPILAVTCVYFLFKCWLIIHTFFVCFFFFFVSNQIKENKIHTIRNWWSSLLIFGATGFCFVRRWIWRKKKSSPTVAGHRRPFSVFVVVVLSLLWLCCCCCCCCIFDFDVFLGRR